MEIGLVSQWEIIKTSNYFFGAPAKHKHHKKPIEDEDEGKDVSDDNEDWKLDDDDDNEDMEKDDMDDSEGFDSDGGYD
ncbi:hypothetical protein HYU23_01660 [Candidatus Woesearchaeota archaeon]|nr:hypothetical protein [Candidatus Woesearchaeota archaeon]